MFPDFCLTCGNPIIMDGTYMYLFLFLFFVQYFFCTVCYVKGRRVETPWTNLPISARQRVVSNFVLHVVNIKSIVGHYLSVVIFEVVVRVNNIVSRKWKDNIMDCELSASHMFLG